VRRFIFDGQTVPRARTQEIAERSVALFARHGFGLWLAREAAAPASAAIVGFGAFWHFRDPPELELLYGVADDKVGRGYGVEIADAIVSHGFDVLHMPVIRASTDAANVPSQRVLDRLGFALERRGTVGGLDTLFYSRSNPAANDRASAGRGPA
jgi:ribosomal-protein-alanine N-acetyltransferase